MTISPIYPHEPKLINRVRYQPDATKLRTCRSSTENEGFQLQVHIEQQAIEILEKADFCPIAGTPPDEQLEFFKQQETVTQSEISVKKAINSCCQQVPKLKYAIENNPVTYFETSKTVNLSIDDVGVKKQKEFRVPGDKKTLKYVHNTVVHLEHEQSSYLLNGHSVTNKAFIGFLAEK